MFKRISKIIADCLSILEKELEIIKNRELYIKKQWDLETEEKFNDLINKYPISEEELYIYKG